MKNLAKRNARIVQLAQAGVPYPQIGQLCGGITPERVGQIAKAAGIFRDPSKARHDWRRTRVVRAEATLHDALLWHTEDTPEVRAAMETLSAAIRDLIAQAQVPA
jgi:hypothetical protein